MKKIIAFILTLASVLSVFAVSAAAVFEPMTAEEMKAALDANATEGEFGGMAFGWNFDDIAVRANEYVLDAYTEAQMLAQGGKYTLTEETAEQLAQRATESLVGVRILESLDKTQAVTVYKFETLEAAEAYAKALEEKYAPPSDETPKTEDGATDAASEESEEPAEDGGTDGADSDVASPYVRQCGLNVVEGDKALAYKVGVEVVEAAVVDGVYEGNKYETIIDGAYTSVNEASVGGIQFKNYDSAIKMQNGEIIFSAAHKDYNATSYKSTDAYMDVYTTEVGYDAAHDAHAGESFVLTARLRAPYTYTDPVNATMELFRTRSSFGSKSLGNNVTVDTVLLRYNAATREVLLVSDGTTVNTGIYLSDIEYTTVAVFVDPLKNAFDFYADGILIVDDATFLPDSQKAKLRATTNGEATGSMEDYTLTRLRLFYTGVGALKGELLCINDFAWYFADEYLEKGKFDNTVVATSVDVGSSIAMNFYLNLPIATLYDYMASVQIEVGERSETILAMSGMRVTDGEYAGLLKYSVPINAYEIDEQIGVSMVSYEENKTLYLYGEPRTGEYFRGVESYTTSVKDYLCRIIAEESGCSEPARALARATLNYGASTLQYNEGNKYGAVSTDSAINKGYEYTADELAAIGADTLKATVNSEVYKEYVAIGSVHGLTVTKNSLAFDDGIYIKVSFDYIGMNELLVNGVRATVDSGKGVYILRIDGINCMSDVYTVTFYDGLTSYKLKLPPIVFAANMMNAPNAKDFTVTHIKSLYLYTMALDAYIAHAAAQE